MRSHAGQRTVNHKIISPDCVYEPKTPDRCMQFGLGQNGELDCSGLIISSIVRTARRRGHAVTVDDWSPSLRHTRDMAARMQAAGVTAISLANATASDIGDLVFSLDTRIDDPRLSGTLVRHVSALVSVDPLVVVQAAPARECRVVERPPIDTARTRLVMDSSILAGLALPECFSA